MNTFLAIIGGLSLAVMAAAVGLDGYSGRWWAFILAGAVFRASTWRD